MKKHAGYLLAAVLAISGIPVPDAHGRVVPKNPSEAFEEKQVGASLAKFGIDDDYEIVVADTPDLVENTAAEVLQKFLGRGGLNLKVVAESKSTGAKRILLGRESDLGAIRVLGDKGGISIRDASAADDGFHLKRIGDDIVIAGANPRGVLYGVYAFEDYISAGARGPLEVRTIPYFRKRASSPGYYWNKYVNFTTEDFPEAKAAYLSRLGINELAGDIIHVVHLSTLVKSDIFPFQAPPDADTVRKFRAMVAFCKRYGMDYYLMLWEPLLPRMNADLREYPEDALGTVRRPWGGGKDGTDRTLCINSPIVQEYYRDLMRKFVREYPDVKGVFLYNMDGSSWICTPELCHRCQSICKDSPADAFNPWETQARLVTLLADAAHEERPGFDFRFWGAIHYGGERFDKMIHAAQGYDSLLTSWNGSDHTVMIPDSAQPAPEFIVSRQISDERAVPLYMVYEPNNLEQLPRSLPFPFHVIDTLKKSKAWGVKYMEEHAGPIPEHNPINALVMKEFLSDPDQSPEKFLSRLAVRQFGEEAGKLQYRAWEEMRESFDVWDDIRSAHFPLGGSQFALTLGTLAALPPPILPDVVNYLESAFAVSIRVEPWLAGEYDRRKLEILLGKLELMNVHLARAAGQAKQAIAAASNEEPVGICHYDGGNGRPTRREYAELNHAPIAIADAYCRQRCNMLRAYLLLTKMETARAVHDAEAVEAAERLYHELIREDIGVQERFHELIAGFARMQPCYTRTSLTEEEMTALLSGTKAKIGKLKEFLARQVGRERKENFPQ